MYRHMSRFVIPSSCVQFADSALRRQTSPAKYPVFSARSTSVTRKATAIILCNVRCHWLLIAPFHHLETAVCSMFSFATLAAPKCFTNVFWRRVLDYLLNRGHPGHFLLLTTIRTYWCG